MKENSVDLNCFYDLLEKDDYPHITKKTTLSKCIKKYVKVKSDESARQRIKFFTEAMYLARFKGFSNTFFLVESENYLGYFTDIKAPTHYMMYIHDKMSTYLYEHRYITNKPQHQYEPDRVTFSWNIPALFMPVLIAYIIAAYRSKSEKDELPETTVQDFIDKMKDIVNVFDLNSFLNDQQMSSIDDSTCKLLKDYYLLWIDQYLGVSYFSELLSLLELGNTADEKKLLRDSVRLLTDAFMLDHSIYGFFTHRITVLIKDYMEELRSAQQQKQHFFTESSPFNPPEERQIIDFHVDKFTGFSDTCFNYAKTFIEQNHPQSRQYYPVAIRNFDVFEQQYQSYLEYIHYLKDDNLSLCIQNDYCIMVSNTMVKANAERLPLYRNTDAELARANQLSAILLDGYENLEQTYTNFLNIVRSVSGEKPENSTAEASRYDLKQLNNELTYTKKDVNKKLKSACVKLPPLFFKEDYGYIDKHNYRTIQDNQQWIHVVRVLLDNPKDLTDDAIIEWVKKQSFSVPLTTECFLMFLKNVDFIRC